MTVAAGGAKLRQRDAAIQMQILALLPDDSLQALQRCMGPADSLTRVRGAVSLARAAQQSRRPDAVVIDPSVLSDAEWLQVRIALHSSTVPVLVYAPLLPCAIGRVLVLSAHGSLDVMFRGVDDDPATVRHRLATLGRPEPPARVLGTLAARIEQLPAPLQGATMPLFCAGHVPRWADEMAHRANVPRRSMDRWMSRAGLAGTAALLDTARLAHVWAPLVEHKVALGDVAQQHGYRRVRMLAVHARRIVGISPLHFGTRLSVDEFVGRLVHHAVRD